jgi:hypothetical protein
MDYRLNYGNHLTFESSIFKPSKSGQGPVEHTPVQTQLRPPPFPSYPPPPQGPLPPSGRRHRLVNATVPQHLLSPTPYRDVLMAGRGRFRRRGQEGRGASAAQPQAAGDRGEQPRGRGVQRGRGDALQADSDRVERSASARGARSGRARGRGVRIDDGSDTGQGDTVQEQPDVGAKTEFAPADGGKGKRKRTVECVICTDDHYTNQCPLLRGPKPSVAYCAALDDNGGFFPYSGSK